MKIRGVDFVWFSVKDMQQAIAFYRDTLGLPLLECGSEWTEFSIEPVTLALTPAGPRAQFSQSFLGSWTSPSP